MANHGNSGQRYTMSKIVSREADGNKVVRTLACGHSTTSIWESPEKAQKVVGWSQGNIGKRTRCNECGTVRTA
jgi:hypothetical protein